MKENIQTSELDLQSGDWNDPIFSISSWGYSRTP